MKKYGLFLLLTGSFLFSYQGQNSKPGFIFPIDGGRKVVAQVDNQSGMEFEIGYVTVTSVDSEGALNAQADQQNVNQLLRKMNQLYVQIYNRYTSNNINNPPTYTPQTKGPPPCNQAPSCAHRRSSKWRQS